MSTKILVFGTGGVGCIYAALLERAGAIVTCVCRSNYDAVKANGILVRSMKWDHIHTKPNAVRTAKEGQAYGPFDYILVCSKAFPGTAEQIADAVTPGRTAIVIAQNGIAMEDEYVKLYPGNNIISGVVYLPTTQVAPGIVEHGGLLELFEIGPYPATATHEAIAQTVQLSNLFAKAGAQAPVQGDIQARRWNKLSLNAAINPVTALTLCDDANFLRSSPYALNVFKDIMREVGTIATASGYPDAVTDDIIDRHMERHLGRLELGGKEPSMLTDIRNGRQIEVEAILGNAVRIAEELKVETPNLKLLYILAKARDFATLKNDGWKPIATVD